VAIGLVQSVDFPCFISTIGAWTERRNRGIITGVWATCSNVGNLVGIQLAALILNHNNGHWQSLMGYISVIYVSFAALIYLFFTAKPSDVGLSIQE